MAIHERQRRTDTQTPQLHLSPVIEVEERVLGLANCCIGPIEVLRHGREYVLDPSITTRVYLLTTDENDLRACDLRATNVTAGDDDFLQIADVLSF